MVVVSAAGAGVSSVEVGWCSVLSAMLTSSSVSFTLSSGNMAVSNARVELHFCQQEHHNFISQRSSQPKETD